ncbi:hypothetical protein KFE98_06420 [bacterium SCSIO 12741]|nr:hypothetical protein KFE98_06420 [bacterium SCSIO 12741]
MGKGMISYAIKLVIALVVVIPVHAWALSFVSALDTLDFLADISVYYFLLIALSIAGQFLGLYLIKNNPDYAGMSFLGMGMVKMMVLVIALLPKMLQDPPDKFLALNAVGLFFVFLLLDSWAMIVEIRKLK